MALVAFLGGWLLFILTPWWLARLIGRRWALRLSTGMVTLIVALVVGSILHFSWLASLPEPPDDLDGTFRSYFFGLPLLMFLSAPFCVSVLIAFLTWRESEERRSDLGER